MPRFQYDDNENLDASNYRYSDEDDMGDYREKFGELDDEMAERNDMERSQYENEKFNRDQMREEEEFSRDEERFVAFDDNDPDFDEDFDGQPDELQEWHDFDPDC